VFALRSNLLVVCLVVACLGACGTDPAPVGYDGPIATVAARTALGELRGLTFEDTTGALGGGTWTITGHAVIPNPRTGKGPVALIESGARTDHLPMESDGDVADLITRVRGAAPEWEASAPSVAYLAVWATDDE
jgi:hypothetical protein